MWDVLTKKGTILRLLKIWIPFWDFDSKMGTKDILKPNYIIVDQLVKIEKFNDKRNIYKKYK